MSVPAIHVFSRQLIERTNPSLKGFRYPCVRNPIIGGHPKDLNPLSTLQFHTSICKLFPPEEMGCQGSTYHKNTSKNCCLDYILSPGFPKP